MTFILHRFAQEFLIDVIFTLEEVDNKKKKLITCQPFWTQQKIIIIWETEN